MVRTDALIRAQKKYYENNKEKIAIMKEKNQENIIKKIEKRYYKTIETKRKLKLITKTEL